MPLYGVGNDNGFKNEEHNDNPDEKPLAPPTPKLQQPSRGKTSKTNSDKTQMLPNTYLNQFSFAITIGRMRAGKSEILTICK